MSSSVKNLLAMFENKGDALPERGRSPANGPASGTESRPLSKIRTNFVAIERDGRVGLTRESSGGSSVSRRRPSPDAQEGAATPTTSVAMTTGAPETDASIKSKEPATTNPVKPVASQELPQAGTVKHDAPVGPDSPLVAEPVKPDVAEVKSGSSEQVHEPITDNPAVADEESKPSADEYATTAQAGEAVNKVPAEEVAPTKSDTNKANGKPVTRQDAPKKEVAKKEAQKKEPPKQDIPKKEVQKKELSKSDAPKKEASKKEASKLETAKHEISKKTGPPKKDTDKQTHSNTGTSRQRTSTPEPNKAKKLATSSLDKQEKKSVPPKLTAAASATAGKSRTVSRNSQAGPEESNAATKTTKHLLTNRAPAATANSGAAPARRKSPASLRPESSKMTATKSRSKSPTRPVKLPPSLTAPTTSSAIKTGAATTQHKAGTQSHSSGATPSRSRSSMGGGSDQQPEKYVRRLSSANLRNASAKQSAVKEQHQAPRKEKEVDESFLARMTRPTQASASKVHERVQQHSVSPPRDGRLPKLVPNQASGKSTPRSKSESAHTGPRAGSVVHDTDELPKSLPKAVATSDVRPRTPKDAAKDARSASNTPKSVSKLSAAGTPEKKSKDLYNATPRRPSALRNESSFSLQAVKDAVKNHSVGTEQENPMEEHVEVVDDAAQKLEDVPVTSPHVEAKEEEEAEAEAEEESVKAVEHTEHHDDAQVSDEVGDSILAPANEKGNRQAMSITETTKIAVEKSSADGTSSVTAITNTVTATVEAEADDE